MKKIFLILIVSGFAFAASILPAFAQKVTGAEDGKPSRVDARLFPLEDLRPGMKGSSRTVFSGAVDHSCPIERKQRGEDGRFRRHVRLASLH
jgi:hypothetical protein